MLAEKLAEAGSLQGVLEKLQGEVRESPGDARLRTFLFQVLVVMGEWERALRQLQTVATLDEGTMMMARSYRELIRCELAREEIFAGRRPPTVLGEPAEWLLLAVKALEHSVLGQHGQAEALRNEAFRLAPAVPGHINNEPFNWIADADSRLGPVLEVVVLGRYYWVPFDQVEVLSLDEPSDLRDLVWLPAHLTLRGREPQVAFLPVRYPGSEKREDAVRLARETTWIAQGDATFFGLGQRMLTTGQADYALLEVRTLSFAPVEVTSQVLEHA